MIKPGQELFAYWVANRAPSVDFMPASERLDELTTIYTIMLALPLEDKDRRDAAYLFSVERNPHFALLALLAMLDGYLPRGGERERPPEDRVSSVEFSRLMQAEPRRVAAALRGVGVEAQQVRFGTGRVTTGFLRREIEKAWKREVGAFVEDATRRIAWNRKRAAK